MSAENAVKKKILHIIHAFGPGGVETWLLAAVKYLNTHPELNLQFDFLLTGGVSGVFDEEIKKYGSKIYYNRYSYKSLGKFGREFRNILKINSYHAVHDHEDFISGWHYLLGGKYLPAIRIAHLHNPYNFVHNYIVNPLRWISFKMGRKLMALESTTITGTSNAVMDEYGYNKGIFKRKRTFPAYCGFDTSKFLYDRNAKKELCKELNWNPSVKVALFVGRIGLQNFDTAVNQKNPYFAYKIARELVIQHPDWRFLFVGYKGNTGENMEEDIKNQNLVNYIRFLGIRHDIPKVMSAADVFVFPSLWEGLGMVAVEAQCTGLRVVMSESVPKEAIVCPELVTVKGLDGGIQGWIDAIVIKNFSENNRSEYAAKVRNSNFSIENSVNHLIGLYGC